MKLRKTVFGYALLGIFLAGMMVPKASSATECEAYTSDASADDTYESNNTYNIATQLTNGVWLGANGDPNCGVMFSSDPLNDPAQGNDYYKIDIPDNNEGLEIDLRFKQSLGDMDLRLYDTNGTTLIKTENTQLDNEFLSISEWPIGNGKITAGTYYIKVYSSNPGANRYRIQANVQVPSATYTVNSSVVGGNGTVDPVGDTTGVVSGNEVAFTLTPNSGYTASRIVGGDCVAEGSWSDSTHYSTGPITANCSVEFSFGLTQVVTSSAGTGGTVAPNGVQDVAYDDSIDFTVTPDTGYTTDATVGGTCTEGSWDGDVYTTGAITEDCTVDFTFTQNATTYTVTPSAGTGGTVSPNTEQTVNAGSTTHFTVTADTGYTTDATVGGTCAEGSWNGDVYTTGAITEDCTVAFTFTQNATTYTVTPSAGTGGSVSPNTDQIVNAGLTTQFTVTPNTGYTTDTTVGGTCAEGSWNGDVYTTGAITEDCTVDFTFTENTTTYTVTPSAGTGGTVSPNTDQIVSAGSTTHFTVTADTGYTKKNAVDGTCPVGSWDGDVYTTGAITEDCTVNFSFKNNSNNSWLQGIYHILL